MFKLHSMHFVFQGGLYFLQLFDHYVCSGNNLLLLSVFQSIAIGWIYGEFIFVSSYFTVAAIYLKSLYRYNCPLGSVDMMNWNWP